MLLGEGRMGTYKGAALTIDALPSAKAMLGDCGYDADWFRAALIAKDIEACIPLKTDRKMRIPMTARSAASAKKSRQHVRQARRPAPHPHPP